MTRREEQAFNDGRVAFREGKEINPRRSLHQRVMFMNGYEHERRISMSLTVTDAQRVESAVVATRLKNWAQTL